MWQGWEASSPDFERLVSCGYPLPSVRGEASLPSGRTSRMKLMRVLSDVPDDLRFRIPAYLLENRPRQRKKREMKSKKESPNPSELPFPPMAWLERPPPAPRSSHPPVRRRAAFYGRQRLFASVQEWVDTTTTDLLDRMARGETTRARFPERKMFREQTEFARAFPLRICTLPEHEGPRVMPFNSTHFASSQGRLTHCKQCKRRYIQKRRS